MRAVLSVGVPSAVQMAVVNLSYALVTGMLNRYGVDVAAAAGVGLQISTIAGLPCWAIGQAITTASAQCAGAGELARARDVARLGARFNIGVTLGIQVLIQLLAPAIVGLYGLTQGAPFDIAVLYLRITCSVNGLFYAAMYSFDSFARGRLAAARAGELAHRRVRRALRPGVFARARSASATWAFSWRRRPRP